MSRREGFTLVEVLVASLLLGMLVTILTMVFNQSSIAWRTGKASVAEMNKMRSYYSRIQRSADNFLPGVKGTESGRVLSYGETRDSGRAVVEFNSPDGVEPSTSSKRGSLYLSGAEKIKLGSAQNFIVGVWSCGPDRVEGTDDDISTWPSDVE